MNITPRLFVLTSLLVIVSALTAWWVARQQAADIVDHWAGCGQACRTQLLSPF